MKERIKNPATRFWTIVLLCVIIIPLLFSYITFKSTLKDYNICFVGPTAATSYYKLSTDSSSALALSKLNYYGTYQSYNNVNYYYIQRPSFPIKEHLLSSCCFFFNFHNAMTGSSGSDNPQDYCKCWPSATVLSNTLNPKQMSELRKDWIFQQEMKQYQLHQHHMSQPKNKTNKIMEILQHSSEKFTFDANEEEENQDKFAIYWDQGHTPFASGQSRWCLSNVNFDSQESSSTTRHFSNKLLLKKNSKAKVKYCTQNVPSVMANSNEAPYFPELPLNPPPSSNNHMTWNNPSMLVQCYCAATLKSQQQQQQQQNDLDSSEDNLTWDIRSLPSFLILASFILYQYHTIQTQKDQLRKQNASSLRKSKSSSKSSSSSNSTLTPQEKIKHQLSKTYSSNCHFYSLIQDLLKTMKLPFSSNDSIFLLTWNITHLYLISVRLERNLTSVFYLNLYLSVTLLNTVTTYFLALNHYSRKNSNKTEGNQAVLLNSFFIMGGISSTNTTFWIYITFQHHIYHLLPLLVITSRFLFFLTFPVLNIIVQYMCTVSYECIKDFMNDNDNLGEDDEEFSSLIVLTHISHYHNLQQSNSTCLIQLEKHYDSIIGHVSGFTWGLLIYSNIIPIQLFMPYIIFPFFILAGYYYQLQLLQTSSNTSTTKKSNQSRSYYNNIPIELESQQHHYRVSDVHFHKHYLQERESLLKNDIHEHINSISTEDCTSSLSSSSSIMSTYSSASSTIHKNLISSSTILLLKRQHETLYSLSKFAFCVIFMNQSIVIILSFFIYDHYKSFAIIFGQLYLFYYCFYQYTLHFIYPNYNADNNTSAPQLVVTSNSIRDNENFHNSSEKKKTSFTLIHYIFQGFLITTLIDISHDSMTFGTWILMKSLIRSFYIDSFHATTTSTTTPFTNALQPWILFIFLSKILLQIASIIALLFMKWVLFVVVYEGDVIVVQHKDSLLSGGDNAHVASNTIAAAVNNESSAKSLKYCEDSLLLLEYGVGGWILPKVMALFFE